MTEDIKKQLQEALAEIRASGMYKEEGILETMQGPEITINGKQFLNFCANNYLGLAGSKTMETVATVALKAHGFGMASVRFIAGTLALHKDLEKEISSFFGTQDAILYTSCFDANTGLFETLLAAGDAVFSDELNHASIIDGIRLCKAELFRYKHSDMQDLENHLKNAGPRRRKLIATDGVFSMDGNQANLAEICRLAEKYGALVMVDDSHGSGVMGERGRGSVEGYMQKIDILTSTFGKALGGSGGGFVAASKEVVEYLRQRSRTYLFSNSVSPVVAASALYVLKNFDQELTAARAKLAENTRYFREKMLAFGFNLGGNDAHPITPIMLFDEKVATQMAQELLAEGVYVRAFTYPVVAKGKARIRVQLSSAHTQEHLQKAVAAFEKVGKQMQII